MLIFGLGSIGVPALLLLAFMTGARFERDRWLELVQRVRHNALSASSFREELTRRAFFVEKDGWTDAP